MILAQCHSIRATRFVLQRDVPAAVPHPSPLGIEPLGDHTIEGGFLGGITAVTAESIGVTSRWVQAEISKENPEVEANLTIYIRALEIASVS